jgi:hypothetical protein
MKKLLTLIIGILMLGVVGCMEEEAYADPPLPPAQTSYGCVVVEDDYGEREVCDTSYYVSPEGVIYWDAAFGIWIGAGGYWNGGVWHYGYWPGYWERYHTFYHGHGFYNGYSHGYYGHHYEHGSFHGGGYHSGGGYHGGHSYHGGGGHGGHR